MLPFLHAQVTEEKFASEKKKLKNNEKGNVQGSYQRLCFVLWGTLKAINPIVSLW